MKKVLVVGVALAAALLTSCTENNSGNEWASPQSAPIPESRPPLTISQDEISHRVSVVRDEDESLARRIGFAESLVREAPESPEAAEAKGMLPSLKEEKEKQGIWIYASQSDPLSKKTAKSASVRSTNAFELDFPYRGLQHGTLFLRKHPVHGRDAFLTIEKGQIMCSTYSCNIGIAIDDKPAFVVTGNESSTNDSEVVFLPYSKLSKRLQGAKEMRVQIGLFQQGNITLVFNVTGFNPSKLD